MEMAIKWRIRELMEQYRTRTGEKLTYYKIEEVAGVSHSTLSLMANNKLANVGVNTIDRLLTFFDCEPNDLMVRVK